MVADQKEMRRRSSRDQSDNCWVLVFLANNLQRWERDEEEGPAWSWAVGDSGLLVVAVLVLGQACKRC